MGFFKKVINNARDCNKIANAVGNVKILLDDIEYNSVTDLESFLIVAWICRVGIIDVMEKGNYPMAYRVYVSINGHLTKMTYQEAYVMSVGRLSFKVGELGDDEIKDAVFDVLEKGEWFYKIDQIIPESKKALFK